MAKRLTRIFTRTGDDGSTGLADGSRLPKDSPRIEAMGMVDELNSHIGMLRACGLPDDLDSELADIQQRCFDIGAELALPGQEMLTSAHVEALETCLEKYNRTLPPLREFILPGGDQASARCHLVRAVCRRTERCFWHLAREEEINPLALMWLNRVSDLFFVYARILGRLSASEEVEWRHDPPEDMK
ncbi:MAG: cob(I)yrinic acid a,c-diamide adenosyltransferase [Gammaproteobacteria bacterium]|nr:cob(I)yrinic acid a,c-diamide adenosyltransferase [Gammaproteobacteria bacterium]